MSRYKRPSKKRDIVGIFCRTYSCSAAIEKFLDELFYLDEESNRYKSKINRDFFLEVDDDQQIVWQKDGNTPYNAFDLVRIYKFGESDLNAKEDTPPNRLPSYKAMQQLCKEDAAVRLTIIREKNRPSTADCKDWQAALTLNDKNEIEKTGQNIRLILLNDSNLSKVRFDRFTKKDITECPDFCNERDNRLDDESIGKIALYIESTYGLQLSQPRILEMLKTTSKERGFNPVHEFITAEDWDGQERIETVVIRYLGADDTPLTRAQTRKWMVGAVARAFNPGCKFDHILTFTGPQGVGKSTFLSTIAGEWFSDSFSFAHEDKAKIEDITGAWIVEISELNGMKRAHDAEAAKAFLSRVRDDVRPAYARKSESIPRSNVFAATTNETEFLQSCNGNRRWWIIPINGVGQPREWIKQLKIEVPQLWAEAYQYYCNCETLYLPPELETEANQRQAEYTTAAGDELLEDIEAFLNRLVPSGYDSWPIARRAQWQEWAVDNQKYIDEDYRYVGTKPLTIVSPKMIKRELPNDVIRTSFRYSSQYINSLLEHIPGWERSEREKLPGMHPDYCGADGRVKRPWIRTDIPSPNQKLPTFDFYPPEEAPF
ncbi:VapE domain-containing protein [uncultured Bacteroides sp.]|uniref:VapE domain-containing protein n=1 Tax=uncultured Bacteroides sp. TaxID=162156 RepID=UPI0034A04300